MPAHRPITLIIVSDYEPGPKTWADEDAAVRAYTNDPAGAPAEIIVAAATQDEATPHPDWTGLNVRMVFIDAEASASMKDAATPDASHDLIAVIEADCVCEPGWLAALHQEMIDKPHLGAVSGTTMYRPTTALRRAASLIDRGFIRAQLANGDYYHVSNNGALYRAALLKANPYPEAVSPFVCRAAEPKDEARWCEVWICQRCDPVPRVWRLALHCRCPGEQRSPTLSDSILRQNACWRAASHDDPLHQG